MRYVKLLKVAAIVTLIFTAANSKGGIGYLLFPPTVLAEKATPSVADKPATPEVALPPIPSKSDVKSCSWEKCDGAGPDLTRCAYEQGMVERQTDPVTKDDVPGLQLVGAYPQSKCGSVQWARVEPEEPETFALRVVQCETQLATSWKEYKNHEGPAWSDMISSPQLCVRAQYAVPDEESEDGWLVIAETEAK